MAVLIVGTMPRNFLFAANLRLYPNLPWAVPLTALYIWFFWRYLQGAGPPDSTSEKRRAGLRARVFQLRCGHGRLSLAGLGSSPWFSRYKWQIDWCCYRHRHFPILETCLRAP